MDFRCNICNSINYKELVTISKPDRFEKFMGVCSYNYSRLWVECNNCGIAVNVMNNATKKAIKNIGTSYYKADSLEFENIKKKYEYIINLAPEKSDNTGRVRRIINFLDSNLALGENLNVCDIGAGIGIFLSKFIDEVAKQKSIYPNCVAIEPDPNASYFLETLGKFETIINGLFPCGINSHMKFDFITLNKVIEHTDHPASILNHINKHLNKNMGFCYIEVPCISSTWLRNKDDNALQSIHYNLYTIGSLARIIEKAQMLPVLTERIIEPSGKITIYAFAKAR